jgi:hypothetical protein
MTKRCKNNGKTDSRGTQHTLELINFTFCNHSPCTTSPIVCHGSTSMYITCRGLQDVVPRHDKACYYFWGREEYLGFYGGGVPNVTKILMVGQSSDSI